MTASFLAESDNQPIVWAQLPDDDSLSAKCGFKIILDRKNNRSQVESLLVLYSTVTLLAKFRGWSTSVPRSTAIW
jgi:hypothetical protein